MQPIKERFALFNQNAGYYQLAISQNATNAQIDVMQGFLNVQIPTDLKMFYMELGSITPAEGNYGEDFMLKIDSVTSLLNALENEEKWDNLISLGLIDYIKYSWGNNRPEFDEYVDAEDIAYINEHYKCFGLYRYTWGFEEANYLYFDKDGKFGEVRYHQDEFDELWIEHLNDLLVKSAATENLQDMVIRIFDKLENGILSEEE
ncbi:hypothetical protein ACIQ57_08520 [Lysinibacillus xylanilyticus]|uniref:hypothetical protein n=1 Tax=Lysinibacillus xylanilyticus TaxID=582475 RepID=UPI0038149979